MCELSMIGSFKFGMLLFHVAGIALFFFVDLQMCIFIALNAGLSGVIFIFQNMCCKKLQKLVLWNLHLSSRKVGQWH